MKRLFLIAAVGTMLMFSIPSCTSTPPDEELESLDKHEEQFIRKDEVVIPGDRKKS